jgi:hypothetical protein
LFSANRAALSMSFRVRSIAISFARSKGASGCCAGPLQASGCKPGRVRIRQSLKFFEARHPIPARRVAKTKQTSGFPVERRRQIALTTTPNEIWNRTAASSGQNSRRL